VTFWLGEFARLLEYAGGVVIFGAPLFLLFGVAGEAGARAIVLAWPRRVLTLAALVLLAGAVLSLAVEAATMTDQPSDLLRPSVWWEVLSGSRFGAAMAVRLLSCLAAALVTLAPPGRGAWRVLTALGAVVLASFALSGHAAMDEGLAGTVHFAADMLHLLVAGVWLGALAVLLALTTTPRLDDDTDAQAAVFHALRTFAGTGSVSVAVLVLTGVVNTAFVVGLAGLGRLLTTGYGLVLLAKILAFLVMLGLAAQNRFRLTPALARGLAAGDARPAMRALSKSIGVESAVAVLVLALVGALGLLSPPAMPM
jgi:putative copper resistance protein D